MHDHPVVVVTGGNSGIGKATAEAHAGQGWKVVVVDVSDSDTSTSSLGPEGMFLQADVSRGDDVRRVVDECRDHYGRIDALVHSAGLLNREATYGEIEEVVRVNLLGPLILSMEAACVMAANGGGAIVTIGSIVGNVGSADHPAYSASKAALVGLTKSLARRYARHALRVNCICPGSIDGTGLRRHITDGKPELTREEYLVLLSKIPLGRLGTPTDVAQLICFLTSNKAVHISGSVFVIDGGEMLNV